MVTLNNIPGDRTIWARHELKYLITESQAAVITQYIRPYMKLDRYSEFREKYAYPICSIYLDSEKLKLAKETLNGRCNRYKLRIRGYSDDPDMPRFFEIKRRVNRTIIKSRARVMPASVAPLIAGELPFPKGAGKENQALQQFFLYLRLISARPIVLVRYLRQAYESFVDNSIRITFDRELAGKTLDTFDFSMNGTGWITPPLRQVILEIKFTGRYPVWLSGMVRDLGLQAGSYSKYCSCLLAALRRGSAGPIRLTGVSWIPSIKSGRPSTPLERSSTPTIPSSASPLASSSPLSSGSSSDGYITLPTADSPTPNPSSKV